jgi:hypothetical protein
VRADVDDRVLVQWEPTAVAEPVVRALVLELIGRDPGPLHHACPFCGSVEHGRPYVDAPVHVSVAHAPGLTLVAVTDLGPVGVDLEAGDDLAWAGREALGKAHGVGLSTIAESATPFDEWPLDIPGHAATVILLRQPAEEAAASGAATRRTGR